MGMARLLVSSEPRQRQTWMPNGKGLFLESAELLGALTALIVLAQCCPHRQALGTYVTGNAL